MNRDRRSPEQVEHALRESLHAHAAQTPDADELTRRILAAAERPAGESPVPDVPRRRRWQTWGMPLVAAASVAVVVIGALAIEQYHPDSDRNPTAESSPAVHRTASPTAHPSTAAPNKHPSTSASPGAPDTSTLHGVRVLDITFTGADDGWALASAKCIEGSGRCTALLRTTDGSTWRSHPHTPFDVSGVAGCPAADCVQHVRFANEKVGYAFGPAAMFMTTDGAQTWQRLPGGADSLETLDGNVIRVSSAAGGTYRVQTASLGSTTWTTRVLPGLQGAGDGAVVVRTGHSALLEAFGHPTGSAVSERAVLWSSTDDGATWRNAGEPCPQRGGEVDSVDLASAADGSFTVACRPRSGTLTPFTVTATGAGSPFRPGRSLPGDSTAPLVGAASVSTLVAAGDGVYRSTDGGDGWAALSAISVVGGVQFLGFESSTTGRLVTNGGRTIWTTRDAGATWHAVTFR